jgi:hypothetical protein
MSYVKLGGCAQCGGAGVIPENILTGGGCGCNNAKSTTGGCPGCGCGCSHATEEECRVEKCGCKCYENKTGGADNDKEYESVVPTGITVVPARAPAPVVPARAPAPVVPALAPVAPASIPVTPASIINRDMNQLITKVQTKYKSITPYTDKDKLLVSDFNAALLKGASVSNILDSYVSIITYLNENFANLTNWFTNTKATLRGGDNYKKLEEYFKLYYTINTITVENSPLGVEFLAYAHKTLGGTTTDLSNIGQKTIANIVRTHKLKITMLECLYILVIDMIFNIYIVMAQDNSEVSDNVRKDLFIFRQKFYEDLTILAWQWNTQNTPNTRDYFLNKTITNWNKLLVEKKHEDGAIFNIYRLMNVEAFTNIGCLAGFINHFNLDKIQQDSEDPSNVDKLLNTLIIKYYVKSSDANYSKEIQTKLLKYTSFYKDYRESESHITPKLRVSRQIRHMVYKLYMVYGYFIRNRSMMSVFNNLDDNPNIKNFSMFEKLIEDSKVFNNKPEETNNLRNFLYIEFEESDLTMLKKLLSPSTVSDTTPRVVYVPALIKSILLVLNTHDSLVDNVGSSELYDPLYCNIVTVVRKIIDGVISVVSSRQQTTAMTNLLNTISANKDANKDANKLITYIKVRDDYVQLPNRRYKAFIDKCENPTVLKIKYLNDNKTYITCDPSSCKSIHPTTVPDNKYDEYLFGPFTRVFGPKITNSVMAESMPEVYDEIAAKNNVCIIGYGSSGAGKTSTLIYRSPNSKLTGDFAKPDPGVIPKMLLRFKDTYPTIKIEITEASIGASDDVTNPDVLTGTSNIDNIRQTPYETLYPSYTDLISKFDPATHINQTHKKSEYDNPTSLSSTNTDFDLAYVNDYTRENNQKAHKAQDAQKAQKAQRKAARDARAARDAQAARNAQDTPAAQAARKQTADKELAELMTLLATNRSTHREYQTNQIRKLMAKHVLKTISNTNVFKENPSSATKITDNYNWYTNRTTGGRNSSNEIIDILKLKQLLYSEKTFKHETKDHIESFYLDKHIITDSTAGTSYLTAVEGSKRTTFNLDTDMSIGEYIRSVFDAVRLIKGTPNNEVSSRSHVVIKLQMVDLDDNNGPIVVICDFAGVENQFNCDYNGEYIKLFRELKYSKFKDAPNVYHEIIAKAEKESPKHNNTLSNLISNVEFSMPKDRQYISMKYRGDSSSTGLVITSDSYTEYTHIQLTKFDFEHDVRTSSNPEGNITFPLGKNPFGNTKSKFYNTLTELDGLSSELMIDRVTKLCVAIEYLYVLFPQLLNLYKKDRYSFVTKSSSNNNNLSIQWAANTSGSLLNTILTAGKSNDLGTVDDVSPVATVCSWFTSKDITKFYTVDIATASTSILNNTRDKFIEATNLGHDLIHPAAYNLKSKTYDIGDGSYRLKDILQAWLWNKIDKCKKHEKFNHINKMLSEQVCKQRGIEGSYINDSLRGLREYIISQYDSNNYDVIPECIPIQCNPVIGPCFNSTISVPPSQNHSLERIIKNYMGHDKTKTKFCIINNINISVNIDQPQSRPFININNVMIDLQILRGNTIVASGDHDSSTTVFKNYSLLDLKTNLEKFCLTDDNNQLIKTTTESDKTMNVSISIPKAPEWINIINDTISMQTGRDQISNVERILGEIISFNASSTIGTMEFVDYMSKYRVNRLLCYKKADSDNDNPLSESSKKLVNNGISAIEIMKDISDGVFNDTGKYLDSFK